MNGLLLRVSAAVVAVIMVFAAGCSRQSVAPAPSALNAVDQIRAKGVIIVGIATSFFPFRITDRDGKPIGFYIDLANAIAAELDVRHELRIFSVNGLIPAVNSNLCDIAIGGLEPVGSRPQQANHTIPYFVSGKALLVSRNYPVVTSWRDLDKPGNIIAVSLGSSSDRLASELFKNARVKKLGTNVLAGFEVVSGGAAAAVHDWPWVKAYSRAYPDFTYAVLEPISADLLTIAVAKDKPEIVDWLNAFLIKYKSSEDYRKSYSYWFVDMPWVNLIPLQPY